MLYYFYLSRYYLYLLSDLGTHFMKGTLAAGADLIMFFKSVFNYFNRQVFKLISFLTRLLFLALVGIVGESVFVFWALKYTTSARASLLANASPISTMLISYFAGREALPRSKLCGMFIGFAGIVMAFLGRGGDAFADGSSMVLGDSMAFASGICWAIYTVYGADLSQKYGGMVCNLALFALATIMMAPIALCVNGGINLNMPWQVWCVAFYLGGLSYGLANGLWYVALKYVTPGELGSLGYLSALLAFMLSIVFLSEKMSWEFLVAIMLVLSGVALMLKKDRPAKN